MINLRVSKGGKEQAFSPFLFFCFLTFKRLIKNLNQKKEGWVPVNSLQIILGDCRFRNARVAGILG